MSASGSPLADGPLAPILTILHRLPLAIELWSAAGTLLGRNAAQSRLRAWPGAELGSPFSAPERDRLLAGQTVALPVRMLAGSAGRIAVQTTLVPLRGDGDSIAFALVISRDVTAHEEPAPAGDAEPPREQVASTRERSYTPLRTSLVDLDDLDLDGVSEVLWEWDTSTGDVVWEDRAGAIFGVDARTESDIVAWQARVHPEDRDRVSSSLGAAVESGASTWAGSYRFQSAQGGHTAVFDRARIVRRGGHAVVVGVMTDVSRGEPSAAREIREALAIFAGGLAHEVNNPLGYAYSNLALALDRLSVGATAGEGTDELRASLREALDGVERVRRVMADVAPAAPSARITPLPGGVLVAPWLPALTPSPGPGAVRPEAEPTTPPAPAEEPRPAAATTAARRAWIVVIDDEPLMNKVVERILGREHDVETFTDAPTALGRIGSELPDLVLCDLMMPIMSGIQLYERVAEARPDLAARIVFVTGGAATQAARDFLQRVSNERVAKPFSAAALRRLVRERLDVLADPED